MFTMDEIYEEMIELEGRIEEELVDYYHNHDFGVPTKLLISSDLLKYLKDKSGELKVIKYKSLDILEVKNRRDYIKVC